MERERRGGERRDRVRVRERERERERERGDMEINVKERGWRVEVLFEDAYIN